MIRHIICAVRGGLASQATADRAIDLASEAGAKLTFLHVVDPGCLDCGDVAMTSAAYREFVAKAESTLHTLSDHAHRRGVDEVDLILQEGDTRQRLRQMAVETDAELMVLGQPRLGTARSVFTRKEFHEFLAELDLGGDLRTVRVTPSPESGG